MREQIDRINAFLNAIEEKNGINDVMSFRLMIGGKRHGKRRANSSCVNDRGKICKGTVNKKCTNSGICSGTVNEICRSNPGK